MSMQSFAVIVEPHRWNRSTEELARLLAPLTGVSTPVLSSLLLRGNMTVEADLTHPAAQALCSRLVGAGVPATIQGTGDRTEDGMKIDDIEAMLAAMGVVDIEIDDELHTSPLGVRPNPITQSLQRDTTTPADESGDSQVPFLAAPRSGPMGTDSGGWGHLFPDLDNAPTQPLDPEPLPPPAQAPITPPVAAAAHIVPKVDLGTDVSTKEKTVERVRVTPIPAVGNTPPKSVESLLANKSEEQKPPYFPTGFDDRTPHSPGIARLFSYLTPGAGQVYNGDDDLALDYTVRAWMIRPWKASADHASRRAERIAEYYLPWPQPGNVFRAIRYVATFWVIIALVATVVFFIGRAVLPLLDREPVDQITEQDVQVAFDNATAKVLEARVRSLDAVAEEIQNNEITRFTMTDEERAERLYRLAYQDCVAGRLDVCESSMRKVTALNPANRNAFRLQTWASSQRRTPDGTKMPDVGEVESLEDYELRKHKEEQ